jgi:hypothetical protein
MPVGSLVVESEIWPAMEIERFVAAECLEYAGVTCAADRESHRGVDPAVAAAVVSGLFSIAVPFVMGLADRFLKADPKTEITMTGADGSTIKLYATLSEAERKALIERAIDAGADRVAIGERSGRP